MQRFFIHEKDYACINPLAWEDEAVETIELPDDCTENDAIDAFYELGYTIDEYTLSDEEGFQILLD